MSRPLRVFLCHASQDKLAVRKLHRYLKQHGIQPWLDQEDLLPGEDWEVEIPRALYSSDVILVCLSKNSVNKEGYVQKEIAFALDKALEKPEGTIFIIPVKLEDCDVPNRLSRYQWVDLFRSDSYRRLLLGLNKRVTGLGADISPVILEDTRQRKIVSKPIFPDQSDPKSLEKAQHNREQPEEKISHAAPQVITGENAKRERAKQDNAGGEPEPVFDSKREQTPSSVPKNNIRLLGLGGIILIGLALFGINAFLKNRPSTNAPEQGTTTATVTPTRILTTATFSVTTTLPTNTFTPPTTYTTFLDIGSTTISEKDGMVLVYVPAGEFTMGSIYNTDEQPIHKVYLDAFWIDKTEVTNAMYAKCVNDEKCKEPIKLSSGTRASYYHNSKYDNYPVIHVDWHMASAYCSWAERRLPTEAEWEKAVAGPNANIYPWGNDSGGDRQINERDNLADIVDTASVDSYPDGVSIYGGLNMAGNVWEWVNDWYSETYYQSSPSSNPLGPDSGQYRVFRGGSWNRSRPSARSANRDKGEPSLANYEIGFRCVRDISP